MLQRKMSFECNGIKYPIEFNLNVMELVQEKYGSLDAWQQLITEKESVSAIKWAFTQMINEGIDIENEEKGENRSFVTEKQVGRLISEMGIQNAAQTMFSRVVDSVKGEEESPN